MRRAIKLQHDCREIRPRGWREFRGQYVLFRRNMDWNEGDDQSCLVKLFPDALVKRVTKVKAKRGQNNHTVKMMLNKEHHKKAVNWTKNNMALDFKRQWLRNSLRITASGDCEKAAIWRLSECEVGSQMIHLQAIPAQMCCDDVLEWVGEEVVKEYKNPAHKRRLQGGNFGVHHVGAGSDRESCHRPSGSRSPRRSRQ